MNVALIDCLELVDDILCVLLHTENVLVGEQFFSLLEYTGLGGFMYRILGLCTWISGSGCLFQSLVIKSFFEILSASTFILYLLRVSRTGIFYIFN